MLLTMWAMFDSFILHICWFDHRNRMFIPCCAVVCLLFLLCCCFARCPLACSHVCLIKIRWNEIKYTSIYISYADHGAVPLMRPIFHFRCLRSTEWVTQSDSIIDLVVNVQCNCEESHLVGGDAAQPRAAQQLGSSYTVRPSHTCCFNHSDIVEFSLIQCMSCDTVG